MHYNIIVRTRTSSLLERFREVVFFEGRMHRKPHTQTRGLLKLWPRSLVVIRPGRKPTVCSFEVAHSVRNPITQVLITNCIQ